VTDEEFFEYHELPETESWNLVASLFYRDPESPLADHLGVVPGWELEGAYPYEVVADVDRDDDDDDVHVGYVEGGLANWSAAATVREQGDGRVGAFTFRVVGDGETPVGTAALADLVAELAQN